MAVTFGTPVLADHAAGGASSSLVMSGVTSAQPICAMSFSINGVNPSGISDTFATHYTWTQVDQVSGYITTWIGTGGVGTSGTITITYASGNSGGVAIPCIGASTASGLSAIDVHTNNSGTGGTQTLSLTPTASGDGAFYALSSPSGNNSALSAPWTETADASHFVRVDTQSNPTSGSALSASWGVSSGQSWATAGFLVLAAAAPSVVIYPPLRPVLGLQSVNRAGTY